MATATKKKDADEQAAPNTLPTRFEITAGAREVVEQLNLQVPSEYGGARQAAIACFHALNDQGGNDPTTLTLDLTDGITVSVRQSDYVHGE